jgi:hypothetical protein
MQTGANNTKETAMDQYFVIIIGFGYFTTKGVFSTNRDDAGRWSQQDADALLERFPNGFRCPA